VKIIPEHIAQTRAMFKVISNNSFADCSISLKLGRATWLHRVTGDTLQMLKVKGQGDSVSLQQ